MCGYILGHQLRVVSKGSVGWSGQSAQTSVIMNTQKNDTEAMTQVVRLNNPFFLASTVDREPGSLPETNAAECSILGFIRQFRADPMHGFGGTPDIVCLIVNPFITSPKSESRGDLESITSIKLRLQGVFSMSLP